jgi:hypothetical protein
MAKKNDVNTSPNDVRQACLIDLSLDDVARGESIDINLLEAKQNFRGETLAFLLLPTRFNVFKI